MRVLFVTNMWPDLERPWHGSFVYSQARSLRRLGIDLDVLTIRGYASRWEYLAACGKLARRNSTGRYDVIHAHYGYSAVVACSDRRSPLVISYCGDDLLGTPAADRPDHMSPQSRVLAKAFAQVGRLATATITKSDQMMFELPPNVRARNHVIPNGVDLETFKRIDRVQARRDLGWEPDETVVLFVGNPMTPRKNYALAERAFRLAALNDPSLRLRVAQGVAPDMMPTWMSAADALIHPSWSEGSPNVVKEAMACELPIVATPVGDVPERLRGIAGCHVLPGDAPAFAEALLDAVCHHPCAVARSVVAQLSLERVARRVIDVYESVTP